MRKSHSREGQLYIGPIQDGPRNAEITTYDESYLWNAAIHQPAENRSQLFTRVFFSFFIQYDQKASRIQLFFNQPGLSGHLRCLLLPIFLLKLRHWNDLGRKQSMQALHVTVLKFRKQRIFRFSNPKKSEAHGMIESTVYGQTHRLEPVIRSFPE